MRARLASPTPIACNTRTHSPVNMKSTNASRPPGLSTRTISRNTCSRSARLFTSCTTKLETATSVLKKQVTKALPLGAEIVVRKGERLARWKDAKGKKRTAPLTTGRDGKDRIVIESSKWFAKYRDGAGVVQVVPTGCEDETAARQVLADLERKAELVRSGMLSAAEAAVAGHLGGHHGPLQRLP